MGAGAVVFELTESTNKLFLSTPYIIILYWYLDVKDEDFYVTAYQDLVANWYKQMSFTVDEAYIPWFLGCAPVQRGINPTQYIRNIKVYAILWEDIHPVISRIQALRIQIPARMKAENAKITLEIKDKGWTARWVAPHL